MLIKQSITFIFSILILGLSANAAQAATLIDARIFIGTNPFLPAPFNLCPPLCDPSDMVIVGTNPANANVRNNTMFNIKDFVFVILEGQDAVWNLDGSSSDIFRDISVTANGKIIRFDNGIIPMMIPNIEFHTIFLTDEGKNIRFKASFSSSVQSVPETSSRNQFHSIFTISRYFGNRFITCSQKEATDVIPQYLASNWRNQPQICSGYD